MAQSARYGDRDGQAAFGPRWADAVGRGDVFDATSGWMRGYVADLCNLRTPPQHEHGPGDSIDLVGGLMRRLLGRLRNG
jgi:hypothetical protein